MIDVDISDAIKMLDRTKVDIAKASKTIEARLSLKGESFMKLQSPVLTGTLRRSMHAYPTRTPWGIATSVNYAYMANVRSRRPYFIEKTVSYIGQIAHVESERIIKAALS